MDAHLRVVGAPLGTVYAIGDAATVRLDISFLFGWMLMLFVVVDRDLCGVAYSRIGG